MIGSRSIGSASIGAGTQLLEGSPEARLAGSYIVTKDMVGRWQDDPQFTGRFELSKALKGSLE